MATELPLPPLNPGLTPGSIATYDDVYIDRTALLLYWDCPRLFYLARRHQIEGQPDTAPLGLEGVASEHRLFGSIMHKAVECGFTPGDGSTMTGAELGAHVVSCFMPELQAMALAPHVEKEYLGLAYGMAEQLMSRIKPALLDYHTVVAVEQELLWTLPIQNYRRVIVRVKPDLVLQHKSSGQYVYFEWKTTAFTNQEQVQSYHYNPQIQLGMQAVQQAYDHCDWAQVGMFYKGQRRNGVRTSPFCYGYQQPGSPASVTPRYVKGWLKRPVVDILQDHDWTMANWIALMDEEQEQGQFFMTDPIFPAQTMVASLKAQLPQMARALTRADQDQYPQAFNRCMPSFGSGCEFASLCHQVPAGSSDFKPRQPHHAAKPIWLTDSGGHKLLRWA